MPRKYQHKYKLGDTIDGGRVVYEVPVEYSGEYYMLVQYEEGGHKGTSWDSFHPTLIPWDREDLRAMDHLGFINMGHNNPDTYDGYDID